MDDLDCGPLIRASQLARVRGFLADAEARRHRDRGEGDDRRATRRRAATTSSRTLLRDVPPDSRLALRGGVRPGARGDAVRGRGRRDPHRQRHRLRARRRRVDARTAARQLRVARAMRSGQVFVNNYGAGGGVELPFGGVKHSGYGREKGFEALHGFTVLKTVVLQHG